jgi:transposase InsO family protein
VSRFQFVDEYRHAFSVKRLCETLGVSRRGYYQWRDRAPARAAKAASDAAATAGITAAHRASKGVYGSPRVAVELRLAGEVINRKRVARLMRRAQIVGVRLRKRRSAPAPVPAGQVVPDRIERDFTAPEPNRRYVGDITYLPLEGGSFLDLATMVDLHSRRLAGWAIADFTPFMIPNGVRLTSHSGQAADLPADVFARQLQAIAEGRLNVPVAKVYRGLEQVRDAQADLESGTTPGKHVVVLDD